MVAGHLREVRGFYHIVLSYTGIDGKRHTPSKSTGLPVKGNKKKAEALLQEARRQKAQELEQEAMKAEVQEAVPVLGRSNITFTSYMATWLDMVQGNIEQTTLCSYTNSIKKRIIPYFDSHYPGLLLCDLTPVHIQEYYIYERKVNRVSNNTILRRHANIHKALKYAVKTSMIPSNPADMIERPKPGDYKANFCTKKELETIMLAAKGDPLEFAIITATFYGLRRSEIVGLKWSAINFESKTITIRHTVTEVRIEGEHFLAQKDRAKNKSSYRSLPLLPQFEQLLRAMKARQTENQRVCGDCYNRDYLEYVYVDDLGNIIRPDYITTHFQILLKKHNLRQVRFHDLRHSCASLLLANGVNLKMIQEWLGHSNIATTGNIYAHLDVESKQISAGVMQNMFQITDGTETAAECS
jgi:integrase